MARQNGGTFYGAKIKPIVESTMPTADPFLEEVMNQETTRGMTITVAQALGEQSGVQKPERLLGNISNVLDGGAWISFKHAGSTYRTATTRDRQELIKWSRLPPEEKPLFSEHRDFVGQFGPPNVTVYIPPQLATVH